MALSTVCVKFLFASSCNTRKKFAGVNPVGIRSSTFLKNQSFIESNITYVVLFLWYIRIVFTVDVSVTSVVITDINRSYCRMGIVRNKLPLVPIVDEFHG